MKANKKAQQLLRMGVKPILQCDRCKSKGCYGYYILSLKTKGLWVCCLQCGTHPIPYQDGLNLPYLNSGSYNKFLGNIQESLVGNAESDVEPALSKDATS